MLKLITEIHLWVDHLFYRLRILLKVGLNKPITVHPYRGFGLPNYLYIQGRVLRKKQIASKSGDSDWQDFKNNFKRLTSVEIRHASLRIQIGKNTFYSTTDKEGFFILDTNLPYPLGTQSGWQEVIITLIDVPWRKENKNYQGHFLIPKLSGLGIISDIDDTVIRTEVGSPFKLKMFYLTFLKNATKRSPIPSVGAFLSALQIGQSKVDNRPVFYVSKSPWNLYDLLVDFMTIHRLPEGPLLLRDYGLPYQKPRPPKGGHKYLTIQKILTTYPNLTFILVGDNGEKDIELYLEIAKTNPRQVNCIFIRDVQRKRRKAYIHHILEKELPVPVFFVNDYQTAAEYAADLGLLNLSYFKELIR